jgi:riboflavin kinase / FMN adenylyltransferase
VILLRNLNDLPNDFRHGAVAIGNFDGVHLGHARIVERLLLMAKRVAGPAIVFTFDPPPTRILRPEAAPEPLIWIERKAEVLAGMGVDAMVVYPTDAALLAMVAREFFDRIVRERLDARALVEGPNFFFGRHRSGTIDVLRQFCAESGVEFEVAQPVERDGQIVSSSRVRELIMAGQVEAAQAMLGRPYRIRGLVVHGAGRGSQIGYPTANVEQIDTLLPLEGIYAARALAEGKWYPAAVSLGHNPTFGEGGLKVEVYLIGYDGWLYDRPIEVDFLAHLRDIKRFASVDALLAQMAKDVVQAQAFAGG